MVIVLLWDGVENGIKGIRGRDELYHQERSRSEVTSCAAWYLTQLRECSTQIAREVSPAVDVSCSVSLTLLFSIGGE
jgi:hypothetical protein